MASDVTLDHFETARATTEVDSRSADRTRARLMLAPLARSHRLFERHLGREHAEGINPS
jgi:hypothetical protein